MLSMHISSLQNNPPFLLTLNSFTTQNPKSHISQSCTHGRKNNNTMKKFHHLFSSTSFTSVIVRAVEKEKDSQQFEMDPDKAKKALQQLDEQIQTLPKKEDSKPKIKAMDANVSRDEMRVERMPEISDSYLVYTAIALFLFTIFYNVLFYAVIKPSIDGPDDYYSPPPLTSTDQESVSNAAVFQMLPSIQHFFIPS